MPAASCTTSTDRTARKLQPRACAASHKSTRSKPASAVVRPKSVWPFATRNPPLVADLRLWLTQKRARISTKSRLGKKLGYIHRHWDGLQIFLTNGRVEMDTNPVENTIRPITLNRKNALFAGHDEGGRTWTRMASLIETCKMNSIDPYAYLRSTLEAITNGHPKSHIDDLMPWAFAKTSTR